ncbi:integral membrane protein [Purpureocillium lavendulum]|uniref:Integral membrane protein n=1 Tax=Purpureocillium lavendulum TaxID=1247861 RepID=A0AB34G0M5_9HYPO|nr:integral membrane protein [Purpureocillium lavendulum]
MATSGEGDQRAWFLRSAYPVEFPTHDALTKSRTDFDSFIANELRRQHATTATTEAQPEPVVGDDDAFTLVSATDSTTADLTKGVDAMDVADKNAEAEAEAEPTSRFMDGLARHGQPPDMENKMLTENADVAFRSTTDARVDLFAELEDVISGPRLRQTLEASWAVDSLATLKIIFNARSIHLGKSSRRTFYRAAGWLYQNHPLTLIANLRWLSRPVIEKKVQKEGEDDLVLIDAPVEEDERTKLDVKYGVSHGYWKDLLNILALAANGKLDALADPRDVLNVEDETIARIMKARRRGESTGRARGRGRGGRQGATREKEETKPQETKHDRRQRRHEAAVKAFSEDPKYRALHLTVARLFAEQLEADLAALRGDNVKAKKAISLCGKWAPSQDAFHDRHTFVISSIAEIMYPRESLDDVLTATDDRETYLKHARESYRRGMSALRAHLDIVEHHITDGTYSEIKYDRVPSLAMDAYKRLFIEHDLEKFEGYLDRVAQGKAKISGATLLPSTLIKEATCPALTTAQKKFMATKEFVEHKTREIASKVADAQWKTLVQRIKDSGTMSSSIAVCDVSGSMQSPRFSDGTTPMHSAIGLSLLVAEVTEKPFGGAFITFSENPTLEQIDLSKPLAEKINAMDSSSWGYNTNFVKVFEELILPTALENKLKPEEMVKRVFVFSDMQFDAAEDSDCRSGSSSVEGKWSTSYERIQAKFARAGYEMPELVFWNLDGGGGSGDATAPKPVTTTDEGTSLVSGYSQGMLKVFLDGGSFEDPEAEETEDQVTVVMPEDEEATEMPRKKKAKMDPLTTVKKAIGHKAYDMLKVMD